MKARHIPVLMYHHISSRPGLVTISSNTFREQMRWLRNNNWKTLTTADIEEFYQGKPFPRKSVMVTFDDGYLDNWLQAYPILKEYDIHTHIFLITNLIGEGVVRQKNINEYSHKECENYIVKGAADNVMLRWSEIDEMRRDGLTEFHPHTHTHTRWDQQKMTYKEQIIALKEDILLSKQCMEEKMGYCSRHLCWPEGYYNEEYIQIAQALGFNYLYTTERRMNSKVNGTLRIGRISTKEREHSGWLKRRLFYYTTPVFSSLLALHKGPRLT